MMNKLRSLDAANAPRFRGVVCFGMLFMTLMLFGAGCGEKVISLVPNPTTSSTAISPVWERVDEGIDRLEERVAVDQIAARFVFYRFSKERFHWRIATSTSAEGKTMLGWTETAPKAKLIFNAGLFHDDGLPSGFVIASGTRLGNRAFDADRSYLLTLGDTPQISQPKSLSSLKIRDGLQSYPLVIKNGQANVEKESGLNARRTFIGTDTQGQIYVGFAPSESISLFQLSQLLKSTQIAWKEVLNLDGGPSTGFVFRSKTFEERIESFTLIPYVIVVEAK